MANEKIETPSKLIDKVLAQIEKDVNEGDVTSLEELLSYCPKDKLEGYLPEEGL